MFLGSFLLPKLSTFWLLFYCLNSQCLGKKRRSLLVIPFGSSFYCRLLDRWVKRFVIGLRIIRLKGEDRAGMGINRWLDF